MEEKRLIDKKCCYAGLGNAQLLGGPAQRIRAGEQGDDFFKHLLVRKIGSQPDYCFLMYGKYLSA